MQIPWMEGEVGWKQVFIAQGVGLAVIVLLFTVGLCRAAAQEAPAPPVKVEAVKPADLTEVQRLYLQTLVQQVELWQLKAREAERGFTDSQTALKKLLTEITPAGYQINERLELVKLPAQPQPAAKP